MFHSFISAEKKFGGKVHFEVSHPFNVFAIFKLQRALQNSEDVV